jgi:hypothetical protein
MPTAEILSALKRLERDGRARMRNHANEALEILEKKAAEKKGKDF